MPLVRPRSAVGGAAALLAVGLIAVALGAVVGLVVPREFEAAMVVITVAGMQMALGRGGSDAERYLPYTPAVEALKRAVFSSQAHVARPLGLAALYAAALLLLAYAVWARRTRLARGDRTGAAGRTGARNG